MLPVTNLQEIRRRFAQFQQRIFVITELRIREITIRIDYHRATDLLGIMADLRHLMHLAHGTDDQYRAARSNALRQRDELMRLLLRIRTRHDDIVREVETAIENGQFEYEHLPSVVHHYYRLLCAGDDPDASIGRVSESNPSAEASFGKVLAQHYDSVPHWAPCNAGGTYLWCPIGGCYEYAERVSIVHLVDVDFADGQRIANTLFGNNDSNASHMWHPTNGLLVSTRFARLMDEDRAALVPVPRTTVSSMTANGPRRRVYFDYAFVLLDPELIGPSRPRWADGLHGKRLQFLNNNFRPAPHYVNFRLVVTFLRSVRGGGVYFWLTPSALEWLACARTALWTAPVADTARKQGLLYWISLHFGGLYEADADRLWQEQCGPLPNDAVETDALLLSCHLIDVERARERWLEREWRRLVERERAALAEQENGDGGDATGGDDERRH